MEREPLVELVPEVLLVADPVCTVEEDERADASTPSWVREELPGASALGYLGRLAFFVFAPFCLVLLQYMLSDNSLTLFVMGTIVFAGILGQTPQLVERWPWLLKIPLVRDVLGILNRLHAFYLTNEPQSFLFYFFYPISCPSYFFLSRTVRREFRLYAGVFGSVAAALLLESAITYTATYPPHLGLLDAGVTIGFRLIFCMLIFTAFFIPVTTTSFRYHLSRKPWHMRSLIAVGLLAATPVVWVTYIVPVFPSSFWALTHLEARMKKGGFRAELKKNSEMFLLYHGSRLPDQLSQHPAFHKDLTEEFRKHISGLAVNDEAKCFDVFTVSPEPFRLTRPWLGVRVCTHGSPVAIGLVDPEGQFYSSWHQLPSAIQGQFRMMPFTTNSERQQAPILGQPELVDDIR